MYHYTVRSWCVVRSWLRPAPWPPICLSFSHNRPSIFLYQLCALQSHCCLSSSLLGCIWLTSLAVEGLAPFFLILLLWQEKRDGRVWGRTEDRSRVLMKLVLYLVWEYQAPGTRAARGLISWQHASNWVRTMSGPWLWPYRDWITMSGDRQQEGRREGVWGGVAGRVCCPGREKDGEGAGGCSGWRGADRGV